MVAAVGFAFQICLIMVLLLWKPIEDDPALFYVISAAWGVCHAIWEMISFSTYFKVTNIRDVATLICINYFD